MAKIVCPQCGEEIIIDKTSYQSLLSEVAAEEIEKRVKEKEDAITAKLKAEYEVASIKDKENQNNTINELKSKIQVLNEKLDNSKKDTELEVRKAVESSKDNINEKDKEILKLKGELSEAKKDSVNELNKVKDSYEFQLKAKEDEIKRWKEHSVGDSTKDIGESLEKYCSETFESFRADAYPNAYFDKDNEVVSGSKGDFVFRDYTNDKVEFCSIMFEMKNQKDNTEKKHKNEDFFKKLDEDRNNKKCEYAVLVTTLEEDSPLYNKGIVDMSHKYPKMFVVRPQFFMAIIGLIRNMSAKTLDDKREIAKYKEEHIDIARFEEGVQLITDKIAKDYAFAGNIYDNVEKMCDDMITKITKFKDQFATAKKHISAAGNQAKLLTIRRLTKDNETMQEKFKAIEEESKANEDAKESND